MLANCLIFYGLFSVIIYAVAFPHNEDNIDEDDVLDFKVDDDDGNGDDDVKPGGRRRLELAAIRDKWYLFIGMSVLLFEVS